MPKSDSELYTEMLVFRLSSVQRHILSPLGVIFQFLLVPSGSTFGACGHSFLKSLMLKRAWPPELFGTTAQQILIC